MVQISSRDFHHVLVQRAKTRQACKRANLPAMLSRLKKLTGSTLFFPLLFFPGTVRLKLINLYSLLREIDDTIDSAADQDEAERTKEGWLEFIKEFHRQPSNSAKIDRVLALLDEIDIVHIEKIIRAQAAQRALAWNDIQQIESWALTQNGPLGELILRWLGIQGDWKNEYKEQLSIGFQLVNIAKDLLADLKEGTMTIPQMQAYRCQQEFFQTEQFQQEYQALLLRAKTRLLHARMIGNKYSCKNLRGISIWIELYLTTIEHLLLHGPKGGQVGFWRRLMKTFQFLLSSKFQVGSRKHVS